MLVLLLSGSRPFIPNACPRIRTCSWQIWNFFPEKVAPASAAQCRIWCRSVACSQIYCRIPGLSAKTVGLPSWSGYVVLGPRMGASSMNTFMICGTISSWRMNIMHSWISEGELVHLVDNEVMHSNPKGVRKAAISQLALSIFLASNPQ